MFHNSLKRQRLKKGLSQKQVADFLCVSPQSVSKWEKGDALPSIDFLPKLAECLDCDMNLFFANEECEGMHFGVLNSFFALMAKVLNTDVNMIEDIYAFVSENPGATEEAINFCKELMQYKKVNIRSIRNILNCSEAEAKILVGYLQQCEMLETLDIQDYYYVMKDATEGFAILVKIQNETCELMRKIDE